MIIVVMEAMEDLDLTFYSQAVNVHDTQNWLDAMREEIESIDKSQAW